MFLYALNHLVGFENWTMDQIKGYGSGKTNGYTTICHAHPEIEVPGIEVTTGPLGQGIANSVGLAIASKNLQARFNKPGFDVVQSRIYCMTGDGCLMEGVALEAIALAGHLELDNLVLLYDNNQVTCDGPLDWVNTEDVNAKMRACGWHVLEITDGCYDVQGIVAALRHAKTLKRKPIFINIKTVIGVGTKHAGTAKAHHGVFDAESVAESKRISGQDPEVSHHIPERTLAYFRERKRHGEALADEWSKLISEYASRYPDEAAEFERRRSGSLGRQYEKLLDNYDTSEFQGLATREINGLIMEKMWNSCTALCGGGADLVNSNKVYYSESDVFHPLKGYSGRYIRYGIREHAMA
jgi:dihydroxyacetone synthase